MNGLPATVALPLPLLALCLLALAAGLAWGLWHRRRLGAAFERMRRDEERYRTLFRFTTDGVICHSADGRVIAANPAAEAILGLSLEAMQQLGPWLVWRQLCDAGGQAMAVADMPVVRAVQQGLHVKDTIVATTHWQSGAAVWLQLESIPLWRPGEAQPQQLIAVFMDITESRRTEDRFRVIVDSSPNALLMFDPQGVIALANAASQRILGYSQEELIGRPMAMLLPEVRHPNSCEGQALSLGASGELAFGALGDVTARHKNGSLVPVDLGLSPISTAEGRFTLATVVDMTARRQAEQAMSQLAYYDVLTGLPNRRLFIERLQHAVAIRARHPRYGAVLFLDVDNFKSINDSIGHEAGDRMLQQIAARLQQCLRESDSVARIGGDEFVVLLEELAPVRQAAVDCAQDVASKILRVLSQPYVLGGRAYPGSVSIGVTLWGADRAEDVGELLKRSDMAMYDAKRDGRNAVRFFDPRMQEELQQRMRVEAELHTAIAEQQFVLHYQKRVGGDGRVLGAEALVRWMHPATGLVGPQTFIPIAEETGLIVPIGRWVLGAACRQLQRWSLQETTRDLYLSVNISAAELKLDSFVQDVQQILAETGARAAQLELEITESVLFENTEALIAKMQALRDLGLRFALDDFGTGYSSLSYLKVLPLSTLKIDKSFVRDIGTSLSDATIAQTIIRMGQTLGLVVIAEGVETEAQRMVLAQHGCENFQGYLFGRPVPIQAFEEALAPALS